MVRKMRMILMLMSLFAILACSNKPYGHYKDDEMVGTVSSVKPETGIVEVDISEWHKRDLRGAINDYGVLVMVEVTDDVVIKNEAGDLSDISQIKVGQKVLVHPPNHSKVEEYKAKEMVLLEMSYEDKYARLLSKSKDRYVTTVFFEEEEGLASSMEQQLMGLVSNSPMNFASYPEKYAVDYKMELGIEKFPVMLVFDHQGLVYKTYEIDQLIAFFSED